MKINNISNNVISGRRSSTRVEVEFTLDKLISKHQEITHEPTRDKIKTLYTRLYERYSPRYNLGPKYQYQYMKFIRGEGF